MPDKAAALAIGNRAVVCVDVCNDVVPDEFLEVPGSDRARVHRTVVDRFGVGQDDDHFLRALRKRTFDGLRHVNLMRPLLGTNGVTVQRIDHRIAALRVFVVAGRKKHDHVTIDSVTLEIAFKRHPMNLDVFYRDWLCARYDIRDVGLRLSHGLHCRRKDEGKSPRKYQLCRSHMDALSKIWLLQRVGVDVDDEGTHCDNAHERWNTMAHGARLDRCHHSG